MNEKKFDFDVVELAEMAESDVRVLYKLAWALANAIQGRESAISGSILYLESAASLLRECKTPESEAALRFITDGLRELESIGHRRS